MDFFSFLQRNFWKKKTEINEIKNNTISPMEVLTQNNNQYNNRQNINDFINKENDISPLLKEIYLFGPVTVVDDYKNDQTVDQSFDDFVIVDEQKMVVDETGENENDEVKLQTMDIFEIINSDEDLVFRKFCHERIFGDFHIQRKDFVTQFTGENGQSLFVLTDVYIKSKEIIYNNSENIEIKYPNSQIYVKNTSIFYPTDVFYCKKSEVDLYKENIDTIDLTIGQFYFYLKIEYAPFHLVKKMIKFRLFDIFNTTKVIEQNDEQKKLCQEFDDSISTIMDNMIINFNCIDKLVVALETVKKHRYYDLYIIMFAISAIEQLISKGVTFNPDNFMFIFAVLYNLSQKYLNDDVFNTYSSLTFFFNEMHSKKENRAASIHLVSVSEIFLLQILDFHSLNRTMLNWTTEYQDLIYKAFPDFRKKYEIEHRNYFYDSTIVFYNPEFKALINKS